MTAESDLADTLSQTLTHGRKVISIAGCKGLHLDIRPKGKSWRYRYTDISGKPVSVTLGDATQMPLEVARKKAEQLAPRRASRRRHSETSTVPTYGQFVEEHYLPHAFATIKSAQYQEIYYRVHLKPAFGSRRLNEFNRRMIAQFVEEKRLQNYRPGSVNHMLSMLKVTISRAIDWEIGGLSSNPARLVKALPNPPHIDRFLTTEEAERLMAEVRRSKSHMLRFVVPFLLFTGARKREALDAQWRFIDVEKQLWTIPMSKSGKPRYLPLSVQAMQVLADVHAEVHAKRGSPSTWVFPSPETGRPYSTIFHSWNKARRAAGLPDVRMHDLRHSFASALVNRGMTLYDVKEALGHAHIATTQRYAHLSPERLREAVDQAGHHYGSSAIATSCGSNVVTRV